MTEKTSPDFWREIKPGSTVTLTDEQSISASLELGLGMKGLDYVVKSILKIKEKQGLAEWLMFSLDDDEQEIYLVVKIVDQDLSVYVYYEPDEFDTGNRRDVIERGESWVFEEPPDIDNFKYDDLEYSREIVLNFEIVNEKGEEEEIEILFEMKGQGVLYGTCAHDPEQSGTENLMAAIVEYRTEDEYENPEAMILELGGAWSDEGGMITFMLGCTINLSEVDVLKSQKEATLTRKKPSLWEKIIKKAAQ